MSRCQKILSKGIRKGMSCLNKASKDSNFCFRHQEKIDVQEKIDIPNSPIFNNLIKYLEDISLEDIDKNVNLGIKNEKNSFEEEVSSNSHPEYLDKNKHKNTIKIIGDSEKWGGSLNLKDPCNLLINQWYLFSQPYESQSYPDFLLVKAKNLSEVVYFYLECKSVWNCSLPKASKFAIYLHRNTDKIYCFSGIDMISNDEFDHLNGEIIRIRNANDKILSSNFSLYIRPMWNQTKSYSELFPNDLDIKRDVINKLKSLNKKELDITSLYLESKTKDERLKLGQFFTSPELVNRVMLLLKPHLKDIKYVLEPSFGTGRFLDVLEEYPNVVGIEIDEKLFSLYKKDKYKLICQDFLTYETDIKFDLIIGNPPYFEYNDEKFISSKGRYNIYALFIEHSINLLVRNGTLAFIIPPSILSSPTFSLLRKYIKERCDILSITDLGNFDNEVSQQVCFFVIRKKEFEEINKEVIFNYSNFDITLPDKTWKENISIVSGNIVWNQRRDCLSDFGIRLIYSSDINLIPK